MKILSFTKKTLSSIPLIFGVGTLGIITYTWSVNEIKLKLREEHCEEYFIKNYGANSYVLLTSDKYPHLANAFAKQHLNIILIGPNE